MKGLKRCVSHFNLGDLWHFLGRGSLHIKLNLLLFFFITVHNVEVTGSSLRCWCSVGPSLLSEGFISFCVYFLSILMVFGLAVPQTGEILFACESLSSNHSPCLWSLLLYRIAWMIHRYSMYFPLFHLIHSMLWEIFRILELFSTQPLPWLSGKPLVSLKNQARPQTTTFLLVFI